MKPITGDQFLQLTAWLSVNNDDVRALSFKSEEHYLFLNAFSGFLAQTLFGDDLNHLVLFEEHDFNDGWMYAYKLALKFMKEHGITLPVKDERIRMCGLYIRDILAVLFHYPETEPEDYRPEEDIPDDDWFTDDAMIPSDEDESEEE